MSIQPFHIKVSQQVLDDLRSRIKNTRWPKDGKNSGWNFGTNLSYTKELAEYWSNEFDWRKVEREINSYSNFIAEINGCKIHFIHIKGEGKNQIPLIITHGWPSSFLEMLKMIPLLTRNSGINFNLVIPSLPGYGFSQNAVDARIDIYSVARIWYKLMNELGYENFGTQGGDFGSGISMALAKLYPEKVIGLHLNNIEGYYKPFLPEGKNLTLEEISFGNAVDSWYEREGAYAHQQITKPLTLAYGLNDSPVGLCAWIVEKYFAWSDCKGNIESVFTKDELLSNVTLYWITGTIYSSFRLYYESRRSPLHFKKNEFVKVPAGIAHFPFEEPFPPRSYLERSFNIVHWSEMPAGGHFAAMEQPELLAKDIKVFFDSCIKEGRNEY